MMFQSNLLPAIQSPQAILLEWRHRHRPKGAFKCAFASLPIPQFHGLAAVKRCFPGLANAGLTLNIFLFDLAGLKARSQCWVCRDALRPRRRLCSRLRKLCPHVLKRGGSQGDYYPEAPMYFTLWCNYLIAPYQTPITSPTRNYMGPPGYLPSTCTASLVFLNVPLGSLEFPRV